MAEQDTIDYACGECGNRGVKLWRKTHGFDLRCAHCMGMADAINGSGRILSDYGLTDQVPYKGADPDFVGRHLLPAVPTGDTFWGYTSVPDVGVMWWAALPNKVGEPVGRQMPAFIPPDLRAVMLVAEKQAREADHG